MPETSFFDKLTRSMKPNESKKAPAQKKVHLSEDDVPPGRGKKDTVVEEEPAILNETEDDSTLDEEEGQLTIDVYQTPTHIVIRSTVAGVKPDDIDIDITQDMVTIKGSRKQEEEISEDDYFYQECYWGAFSRSVILPQDISPDKSEATMKNGVLVIRLPKLESTHSKKLKIKPGV